MQKFQFKPRSEKGATEIAQFPLTIYCLFLVVLLPVLNLVTLLIAGTTAYLATNDLAAKAATQSTFAQALNAMAVEAYNFQSNSLAQFVKMAPQGGYTGCGNDLYVLATNIGGSGIQSSPADQSIASNIDTTKNIYEMQVVSSYTVSPLVSLASLPLLGSIPGLGQPVTLSFAASRPIEHPGGMQTATNNGGSNSTVTPFNRIAAVAPGGTPAPTSATWRNPDIFTKILNAGQTVVSITVLVVPADMGPGGSPWWKNTGVVLQAGQNVWIDTQAIGTWGYVGSYGGGSYNINTDANGMTSGTYVPELVDANLPQFMMIGYIGNPPLMPYGHNNTEISGDPNFVPSGNYLLNYPSGGRSGPIWLTNNDNWQGDNGFQIVRVIITN